MTNRNAGVAVALLAVLLAGAAGCGRRGRSGGGWLGWAAVPACQSAIRAKALAEFGEKADVEFQGVAEEEKVERHRVRVRGSLTVERKSGATALTYECLANTRSDRLISASYQPAK
jgi:hypothetical protein